MYIHVLANQCRLLMNWKTKGTVPSHSAFSERVQFAYNFLLLGFYRLCLFSAENGSLESKFDFESNSTTFKGPFRLFQFYPNKMVDKLSTKICYHFFICETCSLIFWSDIAKNHDFKSPRDSTIVSGHVLISWTHTSNNISKIASAIRYVRSADQNMAVD